SSTIRVAPYPKASPRSVARTSRSARGPRRHGRRTMQHDGTRRGSRVIRTLSIVLSVALVTALLWGSDRITMQGERTIYTVDCEGGTWNGRVCSGKLAPSKRYAFRASQARQEVIYWIRGSTTASG